MISTEVQRTLVKSPPELWSELSDPESLGRHLGEFGRIRIIRADAEKRVDWEADGASGVVQIKPTGWGTRVTLSVSRELEPAAPATQDAGEEPEVLPQAASDEIPPDAAPIAESPVQAVTHEPADPEPAPATVEPEGETEPQAPLAAAEQQSALEGAQPAHEAVDAPEEPAAAEAAEAAATATAGTRRRGFFARLFRRRGPAPAPQESAAPDLSEIAVPTAAESAVESAEAAPAAAPELVEAPAPAPEPEAEGSPEPVASVEADVAEESAESDEPQAAEPRPDVAGELRIAEEAASEEDTAVLTAVLDRLGAAHHRPFSRS